MNDFEDQDYDKKFELDTWKNLLKQLREHNKLIFTILFVFVCIAVLETILPLMNAYAVDTFVVAGELDTLLPFIGIYVVLIALFSLSVYAMVHLAGTLEALIAYTLRKKAFMNLQKLSYPFYDNTPTGYIMARITSDAGRLGGTFAWSVTNMVWAVFYIVFMLVIMLIVSPFLTGVVMLVMPILFAASWFFRVKMLGNQRDIRKQNSQITAGFAEGINAARTTKTLVRELKNYQEFSGKTNNMLNMRVRAAVLSSLFWPVVLILSNFTVGMVVWQGGEAALLGNISLGTFTLFIGYTWAMFEPINLIAQQFAEFQAAQASSERLVALIETQPDITDTPEIEKKYGSLLNPKPENWEPITGDITFDAVGFKYKTGEKVLEDFNLTVKAGEKIALVGHTGAGKSTIVNLICRFYEPTSGRVLIDGIDYKERSQIWLQSSLGYVLQSPHLFSTTIRENIRYGNLDATDEQVEDAARLVNAYDFIQKLEKGFDTEVGEGGSKLSTGEKQLISFARAILKDPKIFVLDEATASIDTVTEQTIQDAVDKVLEGRTSFIVAHRLSTIKSADRILVLEHGKIIEQGSHRQLLAQKGHYYKLYTNQFMEEGEQRVLA